MAQAKKAKPKKGKQVRKKRALDGGTNIQMERLQLVEAMMAAACTRRDIAKAVAKKFGVTEKTGLNYFDRIEKEWQDEGKPKKSYRRAKLLKQFELVAKGAIAGKKWSAAARALREIGLIYGLYAPEEVVVHTPDMHVTETMTSAQLRAYNAEQREKREILLAQVVKEPASVH